jgi:hypothetical protein
MTTLITRKRVFLWHSTSIVIDDRFSRLQGNNDRMKYSTGHKLTIADVSKRIPGLGMTKRPLFFWMHSQGLSVGFANDKEAVSHICGSALRARKQLGRHHCTIRYQHFRFAPAFQQIKISTHPTFIRNNWDFLYKDFCKKPLLCILLLCILTERVMLRWIKCPSLDNIEEKENLLSGQACTITH